MNHILRFGIIGCGEIDQSLEGDDVYNGIGEYHARYISEVEGAQLVTASSRRQQNAAAFAEKFALKSYHLDVHELLARNDIDVVIICTPSGTHGDIAIAAARAGKHIIIEKPMEVTLEKSDAIIQACRQAGVKLQVVFPHRFGRGARKLKQILDDRTMGKPLVVNVMCRRYRTQAYYTQSSWRGTWALDGGGALMNQGIHVIDVCLHLLGPVSSVYAKIDTVGHQGLEVEDVGVAVIRFACGALGIIEATTCAYPDLGDRIDLHCERGSVVLEGLPPQISSWQTMDEKNMIDINAFRENPTPFYSHKFVIQDMVDAIREDRRPLVDGAEGRKSIEVIQAIYESANKKTEVVF